MIINTGNRTDIPGYYSKWFYQRIKEGFVLSRSPYAPNKVYRYNLDPSVVDCLVFCTKNPQPMLKEIRIVKRISSILDGDYYTLYKRNRTKCS